MKLTAFGGLLFIFCFFSQLSAKAQVFIPHAYWGCSAIDFLDASQADFAAGSTANLTWAAGTLGLSAGQTSGTLISNPFDKRRCTLPPFTPFSKLIWVTDLPYGKELPTTSELTTDYTSLANSTLLASSTHIWRMNGTGAIASGSVITAALGTNARAFQTNGTGFSYTASGTLNSAVTFDGVDDRIEVVGYTQTAITKFTVAMWIRSNGTGNQVFMNNRGASGAGQSLTLSMGANPGTCTGTNGRVSFGLDTNGVYIGRCMSAGAINDNNWHHVVGTFNGTSGVAVAPAQFSIYIDGVAVTMTDRTVGGVNAPLTGLQNVLMGRHESWGVWYTGSIDEVAIWNRVLTATEVQQLYRRGGNRLKFQIRSCTSPTCTDNSPWLGPDGSSNTFFTELNNNSIPSTGLGNVLTGLPIMTFSDYVGLILPNSQLLQYKINFESNTTTFSPQLKSVSATY